MIRIWTLLNSPSHFKIWPPTWPLTLGDLDPDPLITIGGSRATPGASLVKIAAGVSEICWWPWNDLWWSQLNSLANWLNSPANFKILHQVTFDLGWPWPRRVKGYKWCDFGQDRCRGSRVIEEHTYIRRHIPWIIVRFFMTVLVKFQIEIRFSLNCMGIQNCRWRHVHLYQGKD